MTNISFEFFPPKTSDGETQLTQNAKKLAIHTPEFYSVTYGAGGSSQSNTINTVLQVNTSTQINTVPHLSCISSTEQQIDDMLNEYKSHGINKLVALRGDIPIDSSYERSKSFTYATDLVEYIRKTTGDHFHIYVACYPEFHPEAEKAMDDIKHFKQKITAGADCAITQYFYNIDAYFHFIDTCQKMHIDIPIVPGIMPITNYKQLARFSERCGAEIPRWIKRRLESYGDDLTSIRQFGEEVVTGLCANLLANGAPGLHFYTLNKAEPSLAILSNLQMGNSENY